MFLVIENASLVPAQTLDPRDRTAVNMAAVARLVLRAILIWIQLTSCRCQGGIHLLENTGVGGFPTTCKLTKKGQEYAGDLNRTAAGITCQRWNSHRPHYNYYVNNKDYPEGSATLALNKCRNPDRGYAGGPWCYTTSRRTRWQNCNVNFCECKTSTPGGEYMGEIAVTVNNHTCQTWTSSIPHPHAFTNASFPDANPASARNFCRNPNSTRLDGPWCLTTDPNVEWEYCSIPTCDLTLASFTTTTAPTTVPTTTTSTTSTTTSTTTTLSTTPTTRTPPSTRKTTTTRAPASTRKTTAIAGPAKKTSTLRNQKEPASEPTAKPRVGSVTSGNSNLVKIVVSIVIVVVILVVIAVVYVYFVRRRGNPFAYKKESVPDHKDPSGAGYDNPSYDTKKQEIQMPPSLYPGTQPTMGSTGP